MTTITGFEGNGNEAVRIFGRKILTAFLRVFVNVDGFENFASEMERSFFACGEWVDSERPFQKSAGHCDRDLRAFGGFGAICP